MQNFKPTSHQVLMVSRLLSRNLLQRSSQTWQPVTSSYLRPEVQKRSIILSPPPQLREMKQLVPNEEFREDFDLKRDCEEMFRYAIKSVHPKQMIENVLKYNRETSALKVKDETYILHRNVFVVGMGRAVMGMAKAVEDVLGEHLVAGIISVPNGMQEEMRRTQNRSVSIDTEVTILANLLILFFNDSFYLKAINK